MFIKWEKKLDILGPIEQAARCLEIWLKEEKRYLTEKQKQRVAAFMARYFLHEDVVTDQLMLSFLRHYSGRKEVDIEDPASVRQGIKAVLDQAQEYSPVRKGVLAVLVFGAVFMLIGFGAWEISHKKITREQQAELKTLVHQIAELDEGATHAGIWAEIKTPLQVRSYQEIDWWAYRQSRKILEHRLGEIKQRQSAVMSTRM